MIGRRKLGALDVSAIGLGCMSMTPIYGVPDPDEAIATLHRAPDIGIDFIDTSDAYGANGANEELVGRALKGRREKYILATKFGNIRLPDGKPGARGNPEYVIDACEKSLKRLGTDTIDLYFIHRIDDTVPIDDTVGAMVRLKAQGKIRHLGISEAGANTIRRAHSVHPMAALQTEYSLWSRDVEPEILPLVQELGIGFVAYSPLGRGFLTAPLRPPTPCRRTMPAATCRAFRAATRSRTKSWSRQSSGLPRMRVARRRSSASPGCCRANRRSYRSPAAASENGWTRTPRRPICDRPRRRWRRSTRRSSRALPGATAIPPR